MRFFAHKLIGPEREQNTVELAVRFTMTKYTANIQISLLVVCLHLCWPRSRKRIAEDFAELEQPHKTFRISRRKRKIRKL